MASVFMTNALQSPAPTVAWAQTVKHTVRGPAWVRAGVLGLHWPGLNSGLSAY